jgi:uncharacterized protein YndB with AHSA1/START domain
VRLSAERVISRPAAEVFAFVADSSNNPRWQKGQQSCEWTSAPPIGVGSTYDQVARFLGRTLVNRFEVIEYGPGRSMTIRSDEGSFPIEVRRSVEPIDPTRTRLTAEIKGEPTGMFRLAAPLVRWFGQRSVDADYDRLKTLLEGN